MIADENFAGLINIIAEKHKIEITEVKRLAGGDINDVFEIISAAAEKFVVKINSAEKFPGMFRAEKAGLEELGKTGKIDVPKALATGKVRESDYLLLEFKETGKRSGNFWEVFGTQLAALHQTSSEKFGFSENNYIGSLPQQNNWCKTASEFYITQRLEPQIKLARDKNYHLGLTDRFFTTVSGIIPGEPPSLIHGDLWAGNYLVNSSGNPCLFDPSVAYAPREMDLAMMQLFGGFDQRLFEVYDAKFPLQSGFNERIPIWQLYYLLVHLNLFGTGYHSSVINIISRFS